MGVDRWDTIQSIRKIEPSQRTDKEQMAYELYYLVGNIGDICTEVGKLHIESEKAIRIIREMIGKCYDSLDGVEKFKSGK